MVRFAAIMLIKRHECSVLTDDALTAIGDLGDGLIWFAAARLWHFGGCVGIAGGQCGVVGVYGMSRQTRVIITITSPGGNLLDQFIAVVPAVCRQAPERAIRELLGGPFEIKEAPAHYGPSEEDLA